MRGLDALGAVELGFDYMDIPKGIASILKGTGDVMAATSGKKEPPKKEDPAAAERARIAEEKRRAEESNKRLMLGIGGGALGAAVLFALLRKK